MGDPGWKYHHNQSPLHNWEPDSISSPASLNPSSNSKIISQATIFWTTQVMESRTGKSHIQSMLLSPRISACVNPAFLCV